MTWVTNLVNNIPQIVSYVAFGYIYLTAYYWISFKDNKDFNNILFKSLIANYILTTIYHGIGRVFGVTIQYVSVRIVLYTVISVLLGLVIGRLVVARTFNKFLHIVKAGRTTNNNIWDDILDSTHWTWLCIYLKDGTSYFGQCRYSEPFKSEPIIMLTTYQKFNPDGDMIEDYSQDNNRAIVMNTKDFDRIEVVYQDKDVKKKK